jgi:hypothetical protein
LAYLPGVITDRAISNVLVIRIYFESSGSAEILIFMVSQPATRNTTNQVVKVIIAARFIDSPVCNSDISRLYHSFPKEETKNKQRKSS